MRDDGTQERVTFRFLANRSSGGTRTASEEVREAVFAGREETRRMAKVSMRTKDRMIRQYVLETFGPEMKVPSYDTLRRLWQEWFGPDGARQRCARSADLPEKDGHVLVHRPGQVVALDTTVLPVMVREGVFGDPVKMHLTLALDVCTHSLVAFRLTLVSDTSVDAAMVLRDVAMPLPTRADWGKDLEWPYPGIPAAVVAEFAGHPVAGLPFFTPETVTTDHGSVYRNHHLVEVQRVPGCNVLPARVLRPTDKAAVERAFGVIRQLLFEHLIPPGSLASGRSASWASTPPAWDSDGSHSPNPLFAASFAQTGFAKDIPSPELFYELLTAHYVRIDKRRGVKIRGLWYDSPDVLGDYRGELSTRGGKRKGKWVIRRDPRDRRQVFCQDPVSHAWHPLPWTGMPQAGHMPAFGDTRASDLFRKADAAGLKPQSDADLLPVLLELIGSVVSVVPVSKWSTR